MLWAIITATVLCVTTARAAHAEDAAGAVAEPQIEAVHTGIPHDAIYDLNITGSEGLAVGAYGVILHSSDGGGTWAPVESPTELALFGIAVNGEYKLIVGLQGTVLIGDAGGKWTLGNVGNTKRLLNVGVNSAGLAVAVGEFGTIMRSKDAGKTWEQVPIEWARYSTDGYEPHLYAAIVHDNGEIAVAGEFGLVLWSTDGGETWEARHKGEKSLFAMHINEAGLGFAVGQEGAVIRTQDGGQTWTAVDAKTDSQLLGVWSSKQGEVVVCGIRALLRSSDGGDTWSKSTDIAIIRNWFAGIASGTASIKMEQGTMNAEMVYIAGHNGVIARVLR